MDLKNFSTFSRVPISDEPSYASGWPHRGDRRRDDHVRSFLKTNCILMQRNMAVAYWMAHGMRDLFPILNGGELSALYCFIFLFIACNGSGIWSVDQIISSKTENEH